MLVWWSWASFSQHSIKKIWIDWGGLLRWNSVLTSHFQGMFFFFMQKLSIVMLIFLVLKSTLINLITGSLLEIILHAYFYSFVVVFVQSHWERINYLNELSFVNRLDFRAERQTTVTWRSKACQSTGNSTHCRTQHTSPQGSSEVSSVTFPSKYEIYKGHSLVFVYIWGCGCSK